MKLSSIEDLIARYRDCCLARDRLETGANLTVERVGVVLEQDNHFYAAAYTAMKRALAHEISIFEGMLKAVFYHFEPLKIGEMLQDDCGEAEACRRCRHYEASSDEVGVCALDEQQAFPDRYCAAFITAE